MAEYSKTTWVSGTTALSAANLNNLETQYDKIKSETLTLAGTKTFSTIPELPASNPTTDNQAARKLYVDSRVGTVFLGVHQCYTDGTLGFAASTPYPIIDIGYTAAKFAAWTWYIPPIFTSISSIKLVWGQESSSGMDLYWKFDANWAASNEHNTQHSESGTYGVTTGGGNSHINMQAAATPLTLTNLAAGDLLAIKMLRDGTNLADTVTDSTLIYGLLITYV